MKWTRTIPISLCLSLFAVSAHSDGSSYEYDELGRLIKVTYTRTGEADQIIEYSYDPAGNRTQVVVTGDDPPAGGGQKVIVVPLNGFTVIPVSGSAGSS